MKVMNKLVRDKIPDIIRENGDVPYTRILDETEYKNELYKKLLEECNEVLNADGKDCTIEELGDVYEVLSAIAELYNENIDTVKETAQIKKDKRGGFSKRIFLEKTDSK